jgi:hypothetical protein
MHFYRHQNKSRSQPAGFIMLEFLKLAPGLATIVVATNRVVIE